jgi:putative GTP pyrophosphokinase
MIGIENMFERAQERIIRDSIMSDEFLDFIHKNRMPLDTLFAYYRCASMEIETKFKVLNEEFSLQYDRNPIESIKTRIKSLDSLARKMHRKNLAFTVKQIEDNIYDVAGVRVVCSFLDDIYFLADCLLKQDDITLIECKDYIEKPKKSGYRSLHLIVEVPIFLQDEKKSMKVEVQLRTISMDGWASLEHKMRYKKNVPDSEVAFVESELKECAALSAELDEKMSGIRKRIAQVAYDEKDGNAHRRSVAGLI